ncbi:MAG: carboxypeptidase regulatory-like domain-containing protein, partial [Bacteroidetes bacterium]|nr:carboxypeptidase regulatory-like domain-containing protein [Bacteroidota bacterium]
MKQKLLKFLPGALLFFFTASSYAQDAAKIKGIVRAESGEPLEGVTVSASAATGKTPITTVTNGNGMFELTHLKPGSRYNIKFSYVGYQENIVHDFFINEETNNLPAVSMKQEIAALSDVVVIG